MSKYNVKCHRSHFGNYFNLDMPDDCDIVILAKNYGMGLEPYSLLLPCQVYQKDIDKMLRDDKNIKQITIIPARSEDYIYLNQWK